MIKILSIIFVAAAMTSCCNNDGSNNGCNDSCTTTPPTNEVSKSEAPGGVVKAIEYYMEGGRKASSEVAKKGFAETATMSWYVLS